MFVAASLIVAVAGCSPSFAHLSTDANNIVLVSTQVPDAFPDAHISGTLDWSDAGCLSVSGEFGEFLLMMPAGTILKNDEQLTLDDGQSQRIGDEVSWGGGYHGTRDEATGELVEAVKGLPDACITDELAIVNRFTEHWADHHSITHRPTA